MTTPPNALGHLEIMAATERNDRSRWTRVGTAFPTKDGQGYRLKLDFVPTSPETSLILLPPQQTQEAG